MMVKKVEGSYASIDETIQAVRRLLNEGYYLSGDITVVTNRKNHENLEDLTSVQVDKVDTVEDKTAWDRFKGMFAKPSEEATLEQYGIEMHEAVKLEEDLINGKYVVIVNDTDLNAVEKSATSISDRVDTESQAQQTDIEMDEDPLLNGSVDRGPIYGVVKEETNARPLDDIVDDERNKK